ncbi:MAG: hypothetical protein LCH91_22470 [Bacteroidetes bacterium]|nr:hypothetical protein [Bacteroidota bacterium]
MTFTDIDILNLESSLKRIRIRDYGDSCERDAAKTYGLTNIFPQYELFWQLHVVPATIRPHGIRFRTNTDYLLRRIGEISYSIFDDMYCAEQSFESINKGDFGSKNYKNVKDAIKSSGNAIQKIEEIRKAIKKLLIHLHVSETDIFSNKEEKENWQSKRERVISYRNEHTHQIGVISFFYDTKDLNHECPYILNPEFAIEHFGNRQDRKPTWDETKLLFENERCKFLTVKDASNKLRFNTYNLLNETYKLINKKMDSVFRNHEYQKLWGVDHVGLTDLIHFQYVEISPSTENRTIGMQGPQGAV